MLHLTRGSRRCWRGASLAAALCVVAALALTATVTFAMPHNPHAELLFRFHHRSGGGDFILGDTELFKGVTGGAQFISTGLRFRF